MHVTDARYDEGSILDATRTQVRRKCARRRGYSRRRIDPFGARTHLVCRICQVMEAESIPWDAVSVAVLIRRVVCFVASADEKNVQDSLSFFLSLGLFKKSTALSTLFWKSAHLVNKAQWPF